MRRGFVRLAAAILTLSAGAGADTSAAVSRAETLFAEAKELRANGDDADACAKFDESRHLAPGVGVDLYVADCFERAGRTGSAWMLFTEAATLAAERNDPRANLAHARAEALAPKVVRLTIAVAPAAIQSTFDVKLDDGPSLREPEQSAGIPVDPGYHTVTFSRPGAPDELTRVRVEDKDTTVTVGRAAIPLHVAIAPVPAPKGAATAASRPAPVEIPTPFGRDKVTYALVEAGVVGLGVGTAFLVARNQSMAGNGAAVAPRADSADTIGAAIGFGAGGAALVSAVVLYLTAPAARDSALRITPGVTVGGAGAFVSGRF